MTPISRVELREVFVLFLGRNANEAEIDEAAKVIGDWPDVLAHLAQVSDFEERNPMWRRILHDQVPYEVASGGPQELRAAVRKSVQDGIRRAAEARLSRLAQQVAPVDQWKSTTAVDFYLAIGLSGGQLSLSHLSTAGQSKTTLLENPEDQGE